MLRLQVKCIMGNCFRSEIHIGKVAVEIFQEFTLKVVNIPYKVVHFVHFGIIKMNKFRTCPTYEHDCIRRMRISQFWFIMWLENTFSSACSLLTEKLILIATYLLGSFRRYLIHVSINHWKNARNLYFNVVRIHLSEKSCSTSETSRFSCYHLHISWSSFSNSWTLELKTSNILYE